MARTINIMLILVLGVTPAWSKSVLNISDPIKVDYHNIVDQFAHKLYEPASVTDIHEVMVLQSDESQSIPVHQGHLAVLTLDRDRKANRQKYGLNPIPSKKSNGGEPGKQYAWYMEDWLLSGKEASCVGRDMGGYPNSRRSHRPGTYAKFSHSIVQNLLSSIRMVGVHYWLVAGSK